MGEFTERTVRIVSVPLRVSLLGGGTDSEAFLDSFETSAVVLGFNIDRYVTAYGIERRDFSSESIYVDPICDTSLTRCVLEKLGARDMLVSIHQHSDAEHGGTGLGSSSAWVKCLGELTRWSGKPSYFYALERSAGSNCGIQDHCWAESGSAARGPGYWTMSKNGIGTSTLSTTYKSCRWLGEFNAHWCDYFRVGGTRDSSPILKNQEQNAIYGKTIFGDMAKIAKCGVFAAQSENASELSHLIRDSWELKKEMAPGITSVMIDEAVDAAKSAGAIGAKLLGAGGCGYVLVVRPPELAAEVRSAVEETGAGWVHFNALDMA